MTLDDFLRHFEGVRKIGRNWTMRCPAHDDKSRNTLHVALGTDRRRLVVCRAACSVNDIMAAAKLKAADLFEDGSWTPREGGRRRDPTAPPTLRDTLLETRRRARAQQAAHGPLYALGDEIRITTRLITEARHLVGLLGPDSDLAWDLAEQAAALEHDAFTLEAEQDAAAAARREHA